MRTVMIDPAGTLTGGGEVEAVDVVGRDSEELETGAADGATGASAEEAGEDEAPETAVSNSMRTTSVTA
jgi:hypothetical protein